MKYLYNGLTRCELGVEVRVHQVVLNRFVEQGHHCVRLSSPPNNVLTVQMKYEGLNHISQYIYS